jgi:hypothetical protein
MSGKKTALLLLAGALVLPAASAAQPVSAIQRRALTAHVAEYSFTVRVGSGPYDRIGIHRVVKETAPNVPVHSSKAVFMAHGDIWGFDGAFLSSVASPAVPDAHALPVFLAENGVDVWGIDFRWTLVPAGTTDFTFMQDWGIEQDARDLGIGLGVARVTRALTGSGLGKLTLLGWSRGGQISYAYLDGETQLPPALRQVKNFIPVDIYLKTDDAGLRQAACDRVAAAQGGPAESQNGVLFQTLGALAEAAPDQPTPIPLLAGLTNRQAALFAGALTFQFVQPVPFYHFTAGTFDANGLPTGLLYTDPAAFFNFEKGASPFEPNQVVVDGDVATCDQTDVPFDDHLTEIKVPVLYVGAGGGFGEFGVYTTTLLGSTDVTTHIVHKVPAAQRIVDYGHADLFLAGDAQTEVWRPILDWVQAH